MGDLEFYKKYINMAGVARFHINFNECIPNFINDAHWKVQPSKKVVINKNSQIDL